MPNWKKGVIAGSFAAAAVFLVKGNKLFGLIAAGVGAATLATEYPEQLEQLWERAPEYLERGSQLMEAIGRIRERLEDAGVRAAEAAWKEAKNY
jgi:hypothetical protein